MNISANIPSPFIYRAIQRETEELFFFNYFESNGWLVGGKTKMKDWKAAARNWMLNAKCFEKPEPTSNLHVNENKRYDIPL